MTDNTQVNNEKRSISVKNEKSRTSLLGNRENCIRPQNLKCAENEVKQNYYLWFQYPPAFERRAKSMLRSTKRFFNPSLLLEPLPPALKYSLIHNFGFVSSVFTQFLGNEGVGNVQESIGLSK
jgi:hypothetical protein